LIEPAADNPKLPTGEGANVKSPTKFTSPFNAATLSEGGINPATVRKGAT
jgi:hypothetical protein